MTRFVHKLSLTVYTVIVLFTLLVLAYFGFSYYNLPVEGPFRLDHPLYNLLKPTGLIGHGLGIIGSLLIVIGLFGYMARKRMKIFSRLGLLKHWLELHIFLCSLGFVMVIFHTTFKFGGFVSIGFWSLVIVWVSGVVGRFIYIQIPRTIEGNELTLNEMQDIKSNMDEELLRKYNIVFSEIKASRFSMIKSRLKSSHVSNIEVHNARKLIRSERTLVKRIERLDMMKNLFKHWHVIHLPFSLIMMIVMIIHVAISLFFGYKWIF
jgi:hypothetical protein